MIDTKLALEQLEIADREGKLSSTAVKNIHIWLTEPYLGQYAPQVAEHILSARWKELEDAFWTIIPCGTGGRRGRRSPTARHGMRNRPLGERAQGLADY